MSFARAQSLLTKSGTSAANVLSKGASFVETKINSIVSKNSEYVIRDAQREDTILKQLFFTKLAKIPVVIRGAPKEIPEWYKVWQNRAEWTVRDVVIGSAFTLEVYAWFSVGEIIGRGGTITGYYF